MGSGYGFGINLFPLLEEVEEEDIKDEDIEIELEGDSGATGGGGGGGGVAAARPVAVISVGPEGVGVHPVIDKTKLGIAILSAVGSMFLAMNRFKK
jgi:hypothetical protein